MMPSTYNYGMVNGAHDEEVNGLHNSATNGVPHSNEKQGNESFNIPLNQQYAYTTRKLKVVTVGAGFSGLLMAHKFQHRFPEMQEYVEHTILERNHELGGTWLVNTYPGVQCDVPSHIYVSFLRRESVFRQLSS